MDVTTTVEIETNLDLPVNPIPVDLNEDTETDSTVQKIEADDGEAEALQDTERAPQELATETPLVPVTVVLDGDEMNRLHSNFVGNGRTTLVTGITLGALLTKKKTSMKRGDWVHWVETNLVFDIRMAQTYMKLNKHREALMAKYETDSHLGIKDACRMFAKPSKDAEARTASDEFQVEGAVDGGTEIVEADEADTAPESKNGVEDDDESPSDLPMLVVDKLTADQLSQVVQLLRDLGVDANSYRVRREQDEDIHSSLQDKPNPSLDDAVVVDDQEVAHE